MGMATGVGTAGGMVAQAQPPGGAAGVGNPPQAQTEYSGLEAALCCLGQSMYKDPGSIAAELRLQSKIDGKLQPTASVPCNGRGPHNFDNDTHPWGILLH
jgi:hypothetical protein